MQANEIDVYQSTVLVVDDDPDIRHEFASALVDQGYTVKTASDGSEALLCVQLHAPDLILLDVSMPLMSGYEVCRILKANTLTENIPIIFISANDGIQDKLQAFAIGGSDYITKPPQLAEVFARVHLHLALRHLQTNLAQKNHELSQAVFDRIRMLQRTNLLLHAQKEAAIDGIFAVDEQGRIASFNRRFCEMWNISDDLLLGKAVDSEFNDGSPLGTFLIKSALPSVLANLLETTYDDPDVVRRGEIVYGDRVFDYYTSPVSSEQNKFFGLIWCFRDISAKKQTELRQMQLMEDLRKAKEEAEEAVRTKAAFLAMMSHEIRTPINGVIGMTQLLAGTDVNPEQAKYIRTIQVSGEMLLSVINDILDFSKIESGNLELERKEFNLIDTVNSVCNLLSKQADDKNISLQYQINDDLPKNVIGDSSRLRQILINLMGNAIKFTQSGSVEMRINGQLINSNPDRLTYEFRFAIADTGIGIDYEQIQKLFHPFTQADASINRKFGGTGLGLAICKRLVELMHGKIWMESRGAVGGQPPLDWVSEGSKHNSQGSTFHFAIALPLGKQAPIKRQVETFSEIKVIAQETPIKILLVEDNAFNQKVALLMLKKLGYKADVAGNGREAVERLSEKLNSANAYDLIFMDVQMPIMDGRTATKIIRENSASKTKPWIVALTADALPQDMQACSESGMNDYISKPVNIQEIMRSISNYQHLGRINAENQSAVVS